MEYFKAAIAVFQQVLGVTPQEQPDLATLRVNLAIVRQKRFESTGKAEDLEEAIHGLQQLLEDPPHGLNLAACLRSLVDVLQKRYDRTKKLEDLDKAIQGLQQLLEDLPHGLNFAACLVSLVGFHKERYDRTQKLEDLDKAIQGLQQLPEVAPANHPNSGDLACLAILLQERYDRTQKLEELDKAIQGLQQLLEDPRHDFSLKAFGSLVKLLHERCERTGDLDKPIQALEQLLEVASTNQSKIAVLACLTVLFQEGYDRTQDLEDLDKAIQGFQQLLEAGPSHELSLILMLLLQGRYKHTRKLGYREELIQDCQQLLELLPKEPFILAVYSCNLADLLRKRFELTGKMEDQVEAIRSSQQALCLISNEHRNLASFMMYSRYIKRYGRTGKIEDLEEAIRLSEQSVRLTPKDHPCLPSFWICLADALEKRSIQTGKIEDLEQAIRLSEQAVELTSTYHPNRPDYLNRLANQRLGRHSYTGRLDDLGEAIKLSQRAIKLTPPEDHSRLATHRNNLAKGLLRRFEHTGKVEDLEEAIRLSEQAVELTSRDHPNRAVFLSNLESQLRRRYECTGKIDDLEKAIELSQQAVELIPRDHPNHAALLDILGDRLHMRYENTGKLEDLEEAIQLARYTIQLTPKDHSSRAEFLVRLGTRLGRRYDHIGSMDDLDEAINVSQQAVELIPRDDPNYALLLSHAGRIIERKHGRTGKMEDLEEAIRLSQRAIKLKPKDHLLRAESLDSLATQLSIRFEHTGRLEDLEEAAHLSQQAVDILSSVNRSHLAGCLANRAQIFQLRFQRTRSMSDLERAIRASRQAVEFLPKEHPHLGYALFVLGANLQSRYRITKEYDDLEEAVHLSQQAVEIIPKNAPHIALCLTALARMLRDRSGTSITGLKDIEKAIQLSNQAVELTRNDHPDLAIHCFQLGLHYLSLFTWNRDKALEYMLQAWNCTNGSVLPRLRAANMALLQLQQRKVYDSAYTLSLEALDLLPHVRNRSLSLQDQQYVVSHFSGLSVDACAYALEMGRPPSEALESLERGRAVIIGLLMDDRSEESALQATDPDLFELYERLKIEVNMPTDEGMFQPRHTTIRRRPNAIKELEECIQKIRNIPGFGLFEKALTTEQIKQASDDGSIIIVNVSTVRSDAIVVTSTGVNSVPLPGLDEDSVRAWGLQGLTTESGNRGMKNKTYRQFLAWLWHQCVRPVLDEHQYLGQLSVESPPRVWWIGTGLASSFPFHAARDDTAGPAENTYSHVISSYAPSIKALLYSKKQAVKICAPSYDPLKLLVVSMAQTPGARDLPAVKKETAVVIEALKESVRIEMLDQPDTAKVMHHIRHCKIVHFACHGVSNSSDPSQSGLVLQAETAEPRQDILSVRDIFKSQHLQGAVAYLSACSAAENRADELVDEVLHVVSCFQVAGFRHVIGCLWPSDDNVCVEVAKCFYSAICQNGNLDVDDRAIALALHQAVKEISKSDEYRKRPLHWAQFVHYGA